MLVLKTLPWMRLFCILTRLLASPLQLQTGGLTRLVLIIFRIIPVNHIFLSQFLLSYSILSNGFCSLPSDNDLWTTLGLDPLSPPSTIPSSCYHGDEETCHKERRKVPRGCLWWHFHPDQGVRDMRRKYVEIMKMKNNSISSR